MSGAGADRVRIKFQADADLNQDLVRAVCRHDASLDFQTSHQAGLPYLADREVLAFAALENRILVSSDRRTMPHHFAEFITTQTSPGLIIVSQTILFHQAVDDLILIWEASSPEEYRNRQLTIPM